MPFDFAAPPARDTQFAPIHGVPRLELARLALARLAPALREEVAGFELADAGRLVNQGVHFDRVAWRAVWRRPGLPEAAGSLVLLDGEIAN
jgi:hypothetical protein